MNEKTCGNCRFRGEPIMRNGGEESNWNEVPSTYFLCGRIQHDERWKYLRGQGALVTDGSGYHAALCVESEFGCNKWEPKA